MAKKRSEPPLLEPRQFRSQDEIDAAILKLRRRIQELDKLDVRAAYLNKTGEDEVARSNVQNAILDIFGANSPEYREHQYIQIWAGDQYINMSDPAFVQGMEQGRVKVIGILNGLIGRLEETKTDLTGGVSPSPTSYFDRLNLHPRIRDVARDRFMDGQPWDAVFAAAKALINYIKERSRRDDIDGAPLVRAVFSRNNPALAFNALSNQTELDEQEGMMHLYEGAVLAIRNPGGHSFPEGSEQRAIEYISFLSLLAYRVQEAKRVKTP